MLKARKRHSMTAFCGVDAVLVILASATVGLLSARMAKRRAV